MPTQHESIDVKPDEPVDIADHADRLHEEHRASYDEGATFAAAEPAGEALSANDAWRSAAFHLHFGEDKGAAFWLGYADAVHTSDLVAELAAIQRMERGDGAR